MGEIMDLGDFMDGFDPEDDNFRERFEREAHKAFLMFETGVEYDEETGKVTLAPHVQADIVMGVVNLRHDLGALINALGALKFIAKQEVEDMTPRLAMILALADNLVPDPDSVQVHSIPVDDSDEVMN
jgi:hypothetical protein